MFSSTNFQSQPNLHRSIAIETSGRNGSVALVENNQVLTQEFFSHGLKHAAGLLPLIDRLMRDRNWVPADLSHLYVSHGPGSFTGLRIAITLVKTLAFTTKAKIVAVPTAQVLATNAPSDSPADSPSGIPHLIIVLDAKRDQIFTARYERVDDAWIEREPAHLDSLSNMLVRSARPVLLLGEGIPYHEKFLPADRTGISLAPESAWIARAESVAQIGIKMAAQNLFIAPDDLAPLYIRKPEAEEKYEQLNHPSIR